jgi:hypothetical protein
MPREQDFMLTKYHKEAMRLKNAQIASLGQQNACVTDELMRVRSSLEELVDLVQGIIDGEYEPDHLTLQPAKIALKRE